MGLFDTLNEMKETKPIQQTAPSSGLFGALKEMREGSSYKTIIPTGDFSEWLDRGKVTLANIPEEEKSSLGSFVSDMSSLEGIKKRALGIGERYVDVVAESIEPLDFSSPFSLAKSVYAKMPLSLTSSSMKLGQEAFTGAFEKVSEAWKFIPGVLGEAAKIEPKVKDPNSKLVAKAEIAAMFMGFPSPILQSIRGANAATPEQWQDIYEAGKKSMYIKEKPSSLGEVKIYGITIPLGQTQAEEPGQVDFKDYLLRGADSMIERAGITDPTQQTFIRWSALNWGTAYNFVMDNYIAFDVPVKAISKVGSFLKGVRALGKLPVKMPPGISKAEVQIEMLNAGKEQALSDINNINNLKSSKEYQRLKQAGSITEESVSTETVPPSAPPEARKVQIPKADIIEAPPPTLFKEGKNYAKDPTSGKLREVIQEEVPDTESGVPGHRWVWKEEAPPVVAPSETVPPVKKLYRGVRSEDQYSIDEKGNLTLFHGENFDGKTIGISFSPDLNVAFEYGSRFEGGGGARARGLAKVFEIDSDAVKNLKVESTEEIAVLGNKPLVIPKGKYRIIEDIPRKMKLAAWEKEQIFRVKKMSDKELVEAYTNKEEAGEFAEYELRYEDPVGNIEPGVSEDIVGKYGRIDPENFYVWDELVRRARLNPNSIEQLAAHIKESPIISKKYFVEELRKAIGGKIPDVSPVKSEMVTPETVPEPTEIKSAEDFIKDAFGRKKPFDYQGTAFEKEVKNSAVWRASQYYEGKGNIPSAVLDGINAYSKDDIGKIQTSILEERAKIPESPFVKPAEGEIPEPPPIAPKLELDPMQMSLQELKAEFEKAKKYDEDSVVAVFGKEGAKKYNAAQRKVNSSMIAAGSTEGKKASALIDEMEASLTEAQRNRLFGIGEPGLPADELKAYIDAMESLGWESPEALGESLQWAVTRVSPGADVGKLDLVQKMALRTLKYAGEEASKIGWDLNVVMRQALKDSFARFKDPADAEYMLKEYIDILERKKPSALPGLPSPKAVPKGGVKPAETVPGTMIKDKSGTWEVVDIDNPSLWGLADETGKVIKNIGTKGLENEIAAGRAKIVPFDSVAKKGIVPANKEISTETADSIIETLSGKILPPDLGADMPSLSKIKHGFRNLMKKPSIEGVKKFSWETVDEGLNEFSKWYAGTFRNTFLFPKGVTPEALHTSLKSFIGGPKFKYIEELYWMVRQTQAGMQRAYRIANDARKLMGGYYVKGKNGKNMFVRWTPEQSDRIRYFVEAGETRMGAPANDLEVIMQERANIIRNMTDNLGKRMVAEGLMTDPVFFRRTGVHLSRMYEKFFGDMEIYNRMLNETGLTGRSSIKQFQLETDMLQLRKDSWGGEVVKEAWRTIKDADGVNKKVKYERLVESKTFGPFGDEKPPSYSDPKAPPDFAWGEAERNAWTKEMHKKYDGEKDVTIREWRPHTADELKELGLIRDIPFTLGQQMLLGERNIALAKYFNWLKLQPDLVSKDMVNGWMQLPNTKAMGDLAGMWAHPQVFDSMRFFNRMPSRLTVNTINFLNKVYGPWKTGKVVLDTAVQFANTTSNMLAAYISGDILHAPAAVKMIKDKNALYKVWDNAGGGSGGFHAGEIMQDMQPYFEAMAKDLSPVMQSMELARLFVKEKVGYAQQLYSYVEDVGKATHFVAHLKRSGYNNPVEFLEKGGKIPENVIRDAIKIGDHWQVRYSDAPDFVKLWSVLPGVGKPFLTYYYYMFPRITGAFMGIGPKGFDPLMAARAWSVPAALGMLGGEYSRQKLGLSREEERQVYKNRPEWQQQGFEKVLDFISNKLPVRLTLAPLLPFTGKRTLADGTVDENYYSLPLGRFFPGGMSQDFSFSTGDPVFNLIYSLRSGTDVQAGYPIQEEYEEHPTFKNLAYIWRQLGPNLAGGGSFQKVVSSAIGQKDYAGRDQDIGTAILSALAGIKPSPADVYERYQDKLTIINRDIANKENEVRRLWEPVYWGTEEDSPKLQAKIEKIEKERMKLVIDRINMIDPNKFPILPGRLQYEYRMGREPKPLYPDPSTGRFWFEDVDYKEERKRIY